MDVLSGMIIGSVVAVALAAFRLIEGMVDKKKNGNGNGNGKHAELPADVKGAIFDTHRSIVGLIRQHAPENGVERWKWPKELSEVIRTIAENQRAQTALMERWDTSLDKHRDREETVLTEIRDTLRGIQQELS